MRSVIPLILVLLTFACSSGRPASSPPITVATPSPEPSQAPNESTRFKELVEKYFEATLELDPIQATGIGDNRYNDRLAVTISEDYRLKASEMDRWYLMQLGTLDTSKLSEQDRLSHNILTHYLRDDLRGFDFDTHLLPLNQFYNYASFFAQLGSGSSLHPFKSAKDYDDFLVRVSYFEKWVDTAVLNMRMGIEQGVVQPRILMERVVPQLEAHIVTRPEDSIFFRPIENMPAEISSPERDRLSAAYREAIVERIVPAYQKLLTFVKDEYLPKTRGTVGLTAISPVGKTWYAYLVESTTTTSLTPEEIHEIGLSEVTRIHKEIEEVKKQVGFKGDLPAFFKFMQTDPRFVFKSQNDLLERYKETKARIDASTSQLFDLRPEVDYEIRPVETFREKSASSGSYSAGTPDGSRAGVFYVNTYDLKARPNYAMEALSLHEGSPGHHFQISIQQGLKDLPRFRRFGQYTAYVEGWGLYAESLGRELGVYTDPYQYYGKLDAELWRAIRLVLDTGMHAKGWTREQAIEYGLKNSSQGTTRVTAEVERFIAIPSQALAYKIGQLKISELRLRAEKALGTEFDMKAFHRRVLEDGAVPLAVLEAKIDSWIEQESR